MAKNLEGKAIVVTGSSRGLGLAFATRCAKEGAKVVLNGTNLELLKRAYEELALITDDIAYVHGSVAEEPTCSELVATCVDRFGRIDALVNNAGIVRDRTIVKMSAEEFDDVILVGLRGAFLCTREAARAMQEHGGHIVQVTSASGFSGGYGQSNYAAAKAGLMGLMRTAVIELDRFNIRCNSFWPVAQTDMTQVIFDKTDKSPESLGFGKPSDVATGMVWLLSDQARHLNGQCLSFNGQRIGLWTHPVETQLETFDSPLDFNQINDLMGSKSPEELYVPTLS